MVLSDLQTAERKLFWVCPSSSGDAVPGVTTSTTSRFTIPLASFGSSTCWQMAMRLPAATSFGR